MKYENVILAEFRARLNRFAATVWTDGGEEIVHVKNTGRLRELLLPGAQVALTSFTICVCIKSANSAAR